MSDEQGSKDDITLEPDEEGENFKDSVERLKKLKAELAACQKEKQEYLDGWQRAKAEHINAKKREEEERKEFVKFSHKELVKEILPALDSFHIAFGNKAAWEKVDLNWRMGVQYIYSQLFGVLERHGVGLIEPKVGEPFDPKRHASVETAAVLNKEQNHTVLETVQKGYTLHGRVIQPAKVKVGEYAHPQFDANSTQNNTDKSWKS